MTEPATDTEQPYQFNGVAYCLAQAKGVLDRATENLRENTVYDTSNATYLAEEWRDLATAYKDATTWEQLSDVQRRVGRMLG